MGQRGLVLGGGGITGIAWEFGILKGLREAGVDLADADTVLGTSAGSVVGSLLLSKPLDDFAHEAQKLSDPELGGSFAVGEMVRAAPTMARPVTPLERRRRIGRAAVRAHPFGGHKRVALIAQRMEIQDWPVGDLRITAMNAESGEMVTFDKNSGVDLVKAVAASCAVPFVWPAVVIDNVPYFDGGVRSPANADLITDADAVVVLAPISLPFARYHDINAQLRRGGSTRHCAISPDAASRKVIGRRVLDPSRAVEAGLAGERQGLRIAAQVRRVWEA